MQKVHLHSSFNIITGEAMPTPAPRPSLGLHKPPGSKIPNPRDLHATVSEKVNRSHTDKQAWGQELQAAGSKHIEFGRRSPLRARAPEPAPVRTFDIVSGQNYQEGDVLLTRETPLNRPQRSGNRMLRDPELHGYSQSGRPASSPHTHGTDESEPHWNGIAATDVTQYSSASRYVGAAAPPACSLASAGGLSI